jgi:hypothetical protein
VWSVPTPDELGLGVTAAAQPSIAEIRASGAEMVTEHQAEWFGLAALAEQHGFAMP